MATHFVLRPEADHDRHRPEDLFAGDAHVVRDVDQKRRRHEGAFGHAPGTWAADAARQNLRALGL